MTRIAIEVDTVANAAYIRLADNEVVRTVQVDDEVLVDLDAMNVAVGIEVLDEGAPLPFDRLTSDFHVRTEVVGLLKLIRPDVSSFLHLSQGNDGSTTSRSSAAIESAGSPAHA